MKRGNQLSVISYQLSVAICLLFIGNCSLLKAQQDSLVINEYSAGLGFQTMAINHYSNTTRHFLPETYKISTQSLSIRIQSSLLEKLWKKKHKLNVADFLASEIDLGNKYLGDKAINPWFGYRFEYGTSLIWRPITNHQFGIHFILLKFTHTGIMGNAPGSAVVFRYKYKHLLFEPSLESQTQLFIGWFDGLVGVKNYAVPLQAALSVKYQRKGNIYGLRASYFPINNVAFETDYIHTQYNFSIRAFVGLCF